MKITIVLLLAIKVSLIEQYSTNRTNKNLMTNSELYDPGQYPYLVTIESYDQDNTLVLCTGSLIKKLYVITAAHCVFDIKKENIKIYSGSRINNKITRKVVQLYVHHDFKIYETGHAADLSILKLDKSFPNVKRIIKIGGSPKEFENHKAVACVSIGFGIINRYDDNEGEKGYKMITHVKHGEKDCKGYETDELKTKWYQYLCANPSDAMPCVGDDGAPMICNNNLYGICSFSLNYKGGTIECGSENMQSVYVFLHYHIKWINSIVNKKKKSCASLLKPHHTLRIILPIVLCNVLIGL